MSDVGSSKTPRARPLPSSRRKPLSKKENPADGASVGRNLSSLPHVLKNRSRQPNKGAVGNAAPLTGAACLAAPSQTEVHVRDRKPKRGNITSQIVKKDSIAKRGEALYSELERTLDLGTRGFVVIHVASNQYVTGTTRLVATRRYEKKFGREPGYVRKIDGFRDAGKINF